MNQFSLSLATRLLPILLNTRGKQRLSILIYHRVLPQFDPMRPNEPIIPEFDWQMRLLHNNFSPLPLVEAVERLRTGTLPDRAVCVTFDDGYADNELHALPILKKYSIPATVFVSTGFLNGGRMWNDTVIEAFRYFEGDRLDLRELNLGCYNLETSTQRLSAIDSVLRLIKHLDPDIRAALVEEIEKRVTALPNDLMLTNTQIQSLAREGVSIGAHTVNHPILCSVSSEIARREMQDSKSYLEDLLQQEIEVFAYPNGKPGFDYQDEHREMVKEIGFKAAVSTHWGVSTDESDRFQLPRFTPWDRRELKFAIRLLASYRQVDPLSRNERSLIG
jgi:peptidoglycan/xylan/chitin deacetylase (PgdA/CDA1 family)